MKNIQISTNAIVQSMFNIEEVISRFILSQDISSSSKVTYLKSIRKFFNWLNDQNEIINENINRQTVLDYKNHLIDKKYSPLTISGYLVVVRKFFAWTESEKLHPNIAQGIKGAKRSRGFRKDALTIDQCIELFSDIDKTTIKGKRDFALINLLIRTGLRTIEVIRSDIADIRQEGGEAVLWIQGKGRDIKDDYVVLTPSTLKPIRQYLSVRDPNEESDPIFSSLSNKNINQRLTTRSIRRIIKLRLKHIGIDDSRLTAHSLRHTAITLCLEAGSNIQEAKELARHSNINTTMIYAHNMNRIANAPEKKIEEFIN